MRCLSLFAISAMTFINAAPPVYANSKEKAAVILANKIGSFEKFNRKYPGFGGRKTTGSLFQSALIASLPPPPAAA